MGVQEGNGQVAKQSGAKGKCGTEVWDRSDAEDTVDSASCMYRVSVSPDITTACCCCSYASSVSHSGISMKMVLALSRVNMRYN